MRLSELRNTNLNLLVVLQSLASTRSVGATAKELNMSQPAVSRALGQLRDIFQDPLLIKSGATMLATARCEELGVQLGPILEGMTALLDNPEFNPQVSDRVFRIATTDYGAAAILPKLIARLSVDAPGVGVEIVSFGDRAFHELAFGDIDLALVTDDYNPPPNLHVRNLFSDGYVCVVSHEHPLASLPSDQAIALDEYLAWPHVLVVVFGGREGLVDRKLAQMKLSRRIVLWLPYFGAAPLVAACTDAILTIPERVARPFLDFTDLVALTPPVAIEGFSYRAVWHDRTNLDQGARWFRDLLAAVCR